MIGVKAKQSQKIRAMLNAELTPLSDIKRQKGMKLYLFNRRLAKLKRLEGEIGLLLGEGAAKAYRIMYFT